MSSRPPPEWSEPLHRHEESRFNIRAYAWFIVLFVLIGAIIHVVIWFAYGALAHPKSVRPAWPLAEETPVPPEPRLQGSMISPAVDRQDMAKLRAEEQHILASYGWVDRKAGVARIPIDRAMDLVLQRGVATQAAPGSRATRPDTGTGGTLLPTSTATARPER